MVENFFKDLEKAKTAEDIVLNRFKELSNDYVFYPIGNIR